VPVELIRKDNADSFRRGRSYGASGRRRKDSLLTLARDPQAFGGAGRWTMSISTCAAANHALLGENGGQIDPD
jgi:hypothetical protein